MNQYDKEIDEILELAGFQIFPAIENKSRIEAKQRINNLLVRAQVQTKEHDRMLVLTLETPGMVVDELSEEIAALNGSQLHQPNTSKEEE